MTRSSLVSLLLFLSAFLSSVVRVYEAYPDITRGTIVTVIGYWVGAGILNWILGRQVAR